MNQSPFYSPKSSNLARNYSDVFDPAEYECKSDLDLESYARNLSNYLNSLLPQIPFPAFLFNKLETRYNGVLCILKKRSAAKGVLTTRQEAEERLRALNAELDSQMSTPPISLEVDDFEDQRPKKKQKLFSFNPDIKRELEAERKRKREAEEKKQEKEDAEEEESD